MKKVLTLVILSLIFCSSILFAENYKLYVDGVLKLSDNAYIPPDIKNKDWQEYQNWLAAGNTPQADDLPEIIKEMLRRMQSR